MTAKDDPLHRQRNQALKRAGAALAVAGLLLVVALVLEQQATVPARTEGGAGNGQMGIQPTAPTIPVLPSPVPVPAMPAAAQPEQGVAQNVLPAPTASTTPVSPAPSSVLSPTPAPAPAPTPVQRATPAADSAPEASAAPSVPQAIPPAPADGFRIQLGVFGDPANAAALQRELAAKGLPATIQSRVVLGPFADRAAAEKAQAALRKAGHEAGMLLPPARKKP